MQLHPLQVERAGREGRGTGQRGQHATYSNALRHQVTATATVAVAA